MLYRKYIILLIVIIALALTNFFNIAAVPASFKAAFRGLILCYLVFNLVQFLNIYLNAKNKILGISLFLIAILYIFIGFLVSYAAHSGVNLGENIIAFTRLSAGFLIIGFLFKNKVSLKEVEYAVICFSILYSIAFFLALANPSLIEKDDFDSFSTIEASGIQFFRINMSGVGFAVLLYLISLNKVFISGEKKWIAITLFSFFLILIYQQRQLLVWCIVIPILFYIYKLSFKKSLQLILGLSLFVTVVYIVPVSRAVVDGLLEKTNRQNDEGSSTLAPRIADYKYYFKDYNKDNVVAVFFGNGTMFERYNSPYARSLYGNNKYGFSLFISDAGYTYIFIQWGIIGLFLWLAIFYLNLKIKIPHNFQWAKLFIIIMMFYFIGDWSIFNNSYSTSFAIALYVTYRGLLNKRKTFKHEKQNISHITQ